MSPVPSPEGTFGDIIGHLPWSCSNDPATSGCLLENVPKTVSNVPPTPTSRITGQSQFCVREKRARCSPPQISHSGEYRATLRFAARAVRPDQERPRAAKASRPRIRKENRTADDADYSDAVPFIVIRAIRVIRRSISGLVEARAVRQSLASRATGNYSSTLAPAVAVVANTDGRTLNVFSYAAVRWSISGSTALGWQSATMHPPKPPPVMRAP
jgi:hypothetical protein